MALEIAGEAVSTPKVQNLDTYMKYMVPACEDALDGYCHKSKRSEMYHLGRAHPTATDL